MTDPRYRAPYRSSPAGYRTGPARPTPRPWPASPPRTAASVPSETERIHRLLFSDYRTADRTKDFTLTDGRRTR